MEFTKEQLLARIAELEAKAAEFKAEARQYATIRTSEKGGISVYGLGRMPVTLYASQWATVLHSADEIKQHITRNFGTLSFTSDEQREKTRKLLGITE